jgi:diaminopimelate epimerase
MTILVKNMTDRAQYGDIAARLMSYGNVCAEQVGFIEPVGNSAAWARLHMMGGEFCGNAALSLAAVIARDRDIEIGKTLTVPLEISGADGILGCDVTAKADCYSCRIEMPSPKEIKKIQFNIQNNCMEAQIVRLPGISHVILDATRHDAGDSEFVNCLIALLSDKIEEEAFGLMFFEESKKSLKPIVFVKGIGAPVKEMSCASGTSAVGIYLADSKGHDIECAINQPGGKLTATAKKDAGSYRVWIEGEVRIVAEGIAYV